MGTNSSWRGSTSADASAEDVQAAKTLFDAIIEKIINDDSSDDSDVDDEEHDHSMSMNVYELSADDAIFRWGKYTLEGFWAMMRI